MSNNSQPIFSVLSTGLFVFGELNSVKISVIHGVYFLLFYYHSNEIKKHTSWKYIGKNIHSLVEKIRIKIAKINIRTTQTSGFKNIRSRHLVKQLWPPDGCRKTEGRLSTTLAVKGCMLSTQQERSFKWIDPSEWWWREERWTSRESLWLPAIGT